MSGPAPLRAVYVRATSPVTVTVSRPNECENLPPFRFAGLVRGVMYARGALHHYWIESADDGGLYLCPPAWIEGPAPMVVRHTPARVVEAQL